MELRKCRVAIDLVKVYIYVRGVVDLKEWVIQENKRMKSERGTDLLF